MPEAATVEPSGLQSNQTRLKLAYTAVIALCAAKNHHHESSSGSGLFLQTGADQLSLYRWNKHIAEHFFRSICGVYTHHRRRRDPTQYGINIECLDNQPIPESAWVG